MPTSVRFDGNGMGGRISMGSGAGKISSKPHLFSVTEPKIWKKTI